MAIRGYLIQRGIFRDDLDENRKGIDKVLTFDNMGSSEFEWGALPKSLKAIREGEYEGRVFKIGQRSIAAWMPSDMDLEEFKRDLIKIGKGERIHKEFTAFKPFEREEDLDDFHKKFQFWWDIDSHVMWWYQDRYKSKNVRDALIGKI
jgi:hypothetical protein